MQELSPILSNAHIEAWLQQFQLGDRALAQQLLEAFLFVSRDDFVDNMRAMLIREADGIEGKVALYAERELGHYRGIPHRLFKEARRKIRRAIGSAGPAAVKPTKAYDPSVGSEGIVAQMISELCKEYPSKFINHPGPDQIREGQARAFWVVTDLVGSGDRAWNYLEAAWLVRSVRSWRSGGFIKFAVMTYAATEAGERRISSHSSRPNVSMVQPCPTIDSMFSKSTAESMKRLCSAYDPTSRDTSQDLWAWRPSSLGHRNTGALMAFAHGAPNNVPLMFYKAPRSKKKKWVPLFPARVSAGLPKDVFGVELSANQIKDRLVALGHPKLAHSGALQTSDIPTAKIFLVLSAVSHPQRLNDRVLAERTKLRIYELTELLKLMTSYGWIDSRRRLTDQGAGQLAHARRQLQLGTEVTPVGKEQPIVYYPKSLRRPI